VGAVFHTGAALHAYLRFIFFLVPEDRVNDARGNTGTAPDAFVGDQPDAAAFGNF